ncbi:uncharacterized protein RSE6_04119 [Rhynchosporium secalis]|uniref:Uncharacterized protein n=1 Tax=Rhynchosporium secalis TaxID=38038 RepID=A0A1E1M4J1_RHYSE|nr:uncharacterized protein RSE6_04119 [Rhynchosporium secalis]
MADPVKRPGPPPTTDVQGEEDSSPSPPTTTREIPYSILTRSQKAVVITLVPVIVTLPGFASNVYFPCHPLTPTLPPRLSASPELINLTVTSYLIHQVLST